MHFRANGEQWSSTLFEFFSSLVLSLFVLHARPNHGRSIVSLSLLSFSFYSILSFRPLHSHPLALSVFITTLRTFSTSSQVNPSYKLFERQRMETLDRSRFRCLWEETFKDNCRLRTEFFFFFSADNETVSRLRNFLKWRNLNSTIVGCLVR